MALAGPAQVTGYLAPLGFTEVLRQELLGAGQSVVIEERETSPFRAGWDPSGPRVGVQTPSRHSSTPDLSPGLILEEHDRLILASGPRQKAYWAQNIWINPQRIEITSISHGAKVLRSLQRNWALYSVASHRRAQLIQDQLPKISNPPIVFPSPLPQSPMGSWALLDAHTLLAASECSSPFALGELHFEEDPVHPPSRAYLKLWEALTLLGQWPVPGSRCIDAGSCPGGWTWVLQSLGAQVVSVDRSPLAPSVASLPRIEFLKRDVFTLNPQDVGPVDWFFSDVICYPARLLEMVQKWRSAGCQKFVCTIKFQGGDRRADWDVVQALAAIPGSRICHLSHNKHELTWMRLP